MFRAILELCRISNLPTVWTNVIAAWVLGGGDVGNLHLLWLLVGASLVYSAGMILNDTCDIIWDREKRPERPIPSGRIGLQTAWGIGIGGLMAGYAITVFGGAANPTIAGFLVGAIVLYDVYHKPWTGSVVVMGLCRTLLYATSSWAADGTAPLPPSHHYIGFSMERALLAGALLGVYVVALTLIARAEAKKTAEVDYRRQLKVLLMLPVGWALLLNLGTAFHGSFSGASWEPIARPSFVVMCSLATTGVFLYWTSRALGEMQKGGPAIGQAVGLLLAGIPLVDAIVVTPVAPALAVTFCCLPPLLRYWQRWVAAT